MEELGIWEARVLAVAGCIPLDCITEFSNIPLWILQETAHIEAWGSKCEAWNRLHSKQQDKLEIQDLTFGKPTTPERREFLIEAITLSRQSNSRKHSKVVRGATAQLTEYGMSERQAADFVDKLRYAQSAASNSANPKTSYGNLSKYYHRRLADCEEVAWSLVQMLHKQIKDCEESDFAPEIMQRQRSIAYLSGATSRAISGLLELTGAKEYLKGQTSIAKVYANGLEVIRPDVLEE